ncbi:cobalamin-dependent protein [bacterium]|nr:cobalamin-dependent protein [candidate division CSSED10-310 bacterium]
MSALKAYLLVPPSQDRRVQRRHPVRGLLPPLGLLYIAAVLEEEGWDVRFVDAQLDGRDVQSVIDDVAAWSPQLFGLTVLSPFAARAARIVNGVKDRAGDVFTVMGGAHPTVAPHDTLRACPGLDAVVVGEGEDAIRSLAAHLAGGPRPEPHTGVLFQGDDSAVTVAQIHELDNLPMPAWHHLDFSGYAPEPYGNRRLPSINLVASRGCLWSRCTYCIRAGGLLREYRQQSVRRTMEIIGRLVEQHGVRELVFYDEDLFGSPRWLHEFCAALDASGFDLTWTCRARADSIDEDLLAQAKKIGLFSVFIGFESGVQALLDRIHKGITLDQSRRAAGLCAAQGVETVGSFILALPGETPAEGRRTISFAASLGCTYAAFQPAYPAEGTPFYKDCLAAGWISVTRYDDRQRGAKFLPAVGYVPRAYGSSDAVRRMIRRAYRGFYLRPAYFRDRLLDIGSLADVKRMVSGLAFILGLI